MIIISKYKQIMLISFLERSSGIETWIQTIILIVMNVEEWKIAQFSKVNTGI